MNCAVHPEREASGYCRHCGKAMCGECSHKVRDVLYCEDCLAQQVGLPPATPTAAATTALTAPPGTATAPSGHSPGLALMLGFVPGLGAVYNGEYNKAILQVVIFGGLIAVLSSDLGEGMEAFFGCALAVFYLYMPIDAMRSAKARITGEQLNDPLANWTEKRALGPMILIGLGVLFLLNNFHVFDFLRLRQFFLPLLLIGIGFFMLKNRGRGE
jgi:hypothetical protein